MRIEALVQVLGGWVNTRKLCQPKQTNQTQEDISLMSSLVTLPPQAQHQDDDDDHNLALQQDELEALASIFSDDECVVSDSPPYEVRLHVSVPLSNPVIVVVHLPSDYPSRSPPVIGELSCAGLSPAANAAFLDHATKTRAKFHQNINICLIPLQIS